MITKEKLVEIIHDRDDRLESWLKKKPEENSLKSLKLEFTKWAKEIIDTQDLADKNDPLFTPNDLGTVYTFMNVATATRASYVVSKIYIKKLENQLKKK